MESLAHKNILLGVSGSVAAYKAAELVRRLIEAGARVQVVMTTGAQVFVTPMTFQALSGRPVRTELLDTEAEAGMGHIELARWADVILVAPASADFIARLAQGRAQDLLSTVCLACKAPLAVAPAMNQAMWEDMATRDNCQLLQQRGIKLFGPAEGSQACGDVGPGRMLEAGDLVELTAQLFETGSLTGLTVVITAGPTREDIDPVRFISNRSSGKMGYAMATAAVEAGAKVILVSGPSHEMAPENAQLSMVRSAQQMYDAVMAVLDGCDIFIATAAVADYKPSQSCDHKIKRGKGDMTLTLEPTPDILASVAATGKGIFSVGFAAETNDMERYASEKRKSKGIDMVVGNQVGQGEDAISVGFESEDNEVQVFWEGDQQRFPKERKTSLARRLIATIAERFYANKNSA
ncbi:MAG: bifunctional phosphopantothenoylcysteine decarboxylase/phosphopantothenate--cysteine ligase CoaBC [Gammaproteobacteria bacterium]|nr:MAG: bifunctional phosphopantothenoylcysteine decarboxylase/phosphopantothenate--cysteine ligase CoaBC [Gammaproteobacteria bacterium]